MSETELAEVTATPTEGLPPVTASEEAATPSAEVEAVTASPTEAAKEEKPQPAWASIPDAYDVLDHPEIKAIRERDDRRWHEDAKAGFEREFEQKHRDWESTNLNRTVQSAFGRVLEKLADSDAAGFEKAIDRVENLIQPYLEDTRQQSVREGALAAANDFKRLFRTGLDRKSSDELDDLMTRPSTTWQDLFEFREKARIERATAPLQKKLDDAEAEIERLKVGVRENQGHVLGGESGGGVSNMAQADALYNAGKMSHEDYKAARERFGVRDR